jgi:hypothetical protein
VTNPYLDYANSTLPTPRRKVERTVQSEHEATPVAKAPMVLRGAEKALAERSKQYAQAKRWTKAELKALLDGPWGSQIRKILQFLHAMGINDGPALLSLLDDLEWLEKADHNVRMHLLGEIDDAIITLRICSGLPPIDDALPGEPLTIFQIIRLKLNHEEGVRSNDW